jgi:hypothetical protein
VTPLVRLLPLQQFNDWRDLAEERQTRTVEMKDDGVLFQVTQ